MSKYITKIEAIIVIHLLQRNKISISDQNVKVCLKYQHGAGCWQAV